MRLRTPRWVRLLTLVGCGAACSGGNELPSAPTSPSEPGTVSVTDPLGDTFGIPGLTQWDVIGLTLTHETGAVTIRLDLANDVAIPVRGDPAAMVGLVEFDLDQNAATGRLGIIDQLRGDGGSTGMGVDGGINLTTLAPDSTVVVYDAGGNETGRAKATLAGRRISIRVPTALLGNDDGYLDAAVIVGNGRSPTDLAPQSGHLSLTP
jgi:hypothetical protein